MDSIQKIAGIDEAGRGSWAGPVVAACVMLPDNFLDICPADIFPLITDSKKLSCAQRETANAWILQNATVGIGSSDATTIDAIGIKKSNHLAMKAAFNALSQKPEHILIDGNDGFIFDFPSTDIIKGDEKECCIAAASIVAKVFRDALMMQYSYQYPHYGFERHKGYGTAYHRQMIENHGICDIHRKSYKPIALILSQPKLL